ncbi:MAG: nucleotidyltransferase [Firmicutes bacterium]|nr:nucleotidyltransferase [Bacillota bacterium]
MNRPILVIMAAGMGSRYGGLKQIEPVSGKDEIILDFSLFDARRAGFEKAVIIIKEENEADFRRLIDHKAGRFLDIEYAYQDINDIPEGFEVPEGRSKPWGTGHAVLAARHKVNGNFCVINSDDYYGPEAFRLMYDFLADNKDCGEHPDDPNGSCGVYNYAMVGYEVQNTLTENGHVSRGVCDVTEDGFLGDIVERTKIMHHEGAIAYTEDDGETWTEVPEGTIVSMNFWGFTPSILRTMEEGLPAFLEDALANNPMKSEYLLPKCVDELIKAGRARAQVLRSHDRWYGVTYKEDKESVVAALQALKDSGLYPEELWADNQEV